MADFKTHLTSGIINGACFASAGIFLKNLSPIEASTIIIVGTTGALLPDLDSDTGKPLALLFQMISILIPVLLYPYTKLFFTPTTPFLLCYFTTFYLTINYVICQLIKKLTKHRGIMHSVPFSILCGEITFLLLFPSGLKLSIFGSFAVFSGCIIHLILDELNSLSLKFGFIIVMKNSSGSALKFFSPYIFSTITTYFLIIATGIIIVSKFVLIPWVGN